jgi:hypothetical protein
MASDLPWLRGYDMGGIIDALSRGMDAAMSNKPQEALEHYQRAEEIGRDICVVNPYLSLSRHFTLGDPPTGLTMPPEFDEDRVFTFRPEEDGRADDRDGLSLLHFDRTKLVSALDRFPLFYTPPNHMALNTPTHLPHTMLLSAGRSGTVSLHRLFQSAPGCVSYHGYWWMLNRTAKFCALSQLLTDDFWNPNPWHFFLMFRAAEWIGSAAQGLPMIGCNHQDTIMAPAWAAMHPKSKFVYVHRDPVKIFQSFRGKAQWSDFQSQPILYANDPFRWMVSQHLNEIEMIAWYIRFTETFARTFGQTMGDRFIEISADKMFAQDQDEIQRLIEFVDVGLSLEKATAHFARPINVKARIDQGTTDEETAAFLEAYNEPA